MVISTQTYENLVSLSRSKHNRTVTRAPYHRNGGEYQADKHADACREFKSELAGVTCECIITNEYQS